MILAVETIRQPECLSEEVDSAYWMISMANRISWRPTIQSVAARSGFLPTRASAVTAETTDFHRWFHLVAIRLIDSLRKAIHQYESHQVKNPITRDKNRRIKRKDSLISNSRYFRLISFYCLFFSSCKMPFWSTALSKSRRIRGGHVTFYEFETTDTGRNRTNWRPHRLSGQV